MNVSDLFLGHALQIMRLRGSKMDFESRRQRILDKMEDNSIAILYSGIEHHVSADEYDLFTAQANRNFFYLTGLRRDNMVLVLDKCVEPAKTMLFIEEADPTMERWYGRKVTMEEAEEISGIDEEEYMSLRARWTG